MSQILIFLIVLFISSNHATSEYHVAKTGNDKDPGTEVLPFLTIQAAADIAKAGDRIIVHEGVYRERITPPRGGESHSKRIVYKASKGEKVEIKGSEIIRNWIKFRGTVWKATIPNTFFGDYNPYKELVEGDWFNAKSRIHHTGEVYLNEKSLWEMELLEKVLNPKPVEDNWDPIGSTYTWYCESDEVNTYIYANFHNADPNAELVEINVRQSCFYPDKTNLNYITISGFHISQAATQWAPPTAEQIGLIGTNWSKGWIIEGNTIRNSKCSGITLGKYGDKYDNTSENSAEGYVKTIERALNNGWSKENVGSHVVRNNRISECGQTGICGSMGGIFSTIENNDICNIWTKRQWTGFEMGGIKIHAPIDMIIRKNRLTNCGRGLWLDWMTQGTRVTGNLFYNNTTDDLFIEVSHGPYLVDNNILLSNLSIKDWSQGGAYTHNLIAGNISTRVTQRDTPFHFPHSTEIAGLKTSLGGDNRYYNNIFVKGAEEKRNAKSGLASYAEVKHPMYIDGNVYLNGAQIFEKEDNSLELPYDPGIRLDEKGAGTYLLINVDKAILKMKNQMVTTEVLGKALISNQAFVDPLHSEIKLDKDFLGKERSKRNPSVGPFEKFSEGLNRIRVWK